MIGYSRRSILKAGAAVALGGALNFDGIAKAWAQTSEFKPEPDAKITLLRYKRFLAAEGDAYDAMIAGFTKATGVNVSIIMESIDDIQPKASIAANTGAGPDVILGLYSLPHLFPSKCLDVTDLATAIGQKDGGWAASSAKYGQEGGKWITLPFFYTGNPINYRISAVEKAGFKEFPKTLDGFLDVMKALKANGTPGGMALGHATSDANNWTHWCLWAHNGSLVDEKGAVTINSPETAQALEYAKKLYETFAPGATSWNDASNNKAFLAGELYCTNNGISIYLTAKNEKPDIAADMNHADWPVGPAGKQTTFDTCYTSTIMGYTKFPNACKALLAFMFDPTIYNTYVEKSGGFIAPPVLGFDDNPVWKSDPKLTALKNTARNTMTAGHRGAVDNRAAAALADFLVVDMFANVCTGRETVASAMSMADRQARRIYR
jgi:multiple sugar transport system substrate-binding protein